MRLHRRKVTIEIEHFRLRVEHEVPDSPVDDPLHSAVSGLVPCPPERRSTAANDTFRAPPLPAEEIA